MSKPIRPLYVWSGYVLLALFMGNVAGAQWWAKLLMMAAFGLAISETFRFIQAKKAVVAPQPPVTKVSLYVHRTYDDPAPEDEEPHKGKLWTGEKRIRFSYRTGDVDSNEREVTVYEISTAGSGWSDDIYFKGHCHLRNEERTFRLDRVRYRNKVQNVETGEVGTLRQIFDIKQRLAR